MFTYDQIFSTKESILFVVAHPDDTEVYFAGLIAKLCQDKKDVHVIVVTNGARGSRDDIIAENVLAKKRLSEQENALEILGAKKEQLVCLNYKDGEVESNYTLIGEISLYIRKYKADLVCTHEPTHIYQQTYSKSGFFVQHRDHRKTGEAVIDAAYPFSRDRSFFPEQYDDKIEPHTVLDILLTDESGANFDFEINDFTELKRKALMAHKSQYDENSAEETLNAWKFGEKYLEKFKYVNLLW